MKIFNNSPRPNRIHYKVDGKTFHFPLKAYETADIPLLNDFSQIVGKYDRRVLQSASDIDMGTLSGYIKSKRLSVKIPSSILEEAPSTPVEFDMRSVLSEAGQTRYDAVSDNEWFLVDRTDYEAVRAASSSSQYIMEDDLLYTEEDLGTFAANLSLTYNDNLNPLGSIPAGKKIIGYTYRTNMASGDFNASLRVNNSFKGDAGVQIGNTLSAVYLNANQTYVLLKNASFVTEEKSYIIQLNNWGTRRTQTFNYPMAYSSALPNWTDWAGASVLMQVIATDAVPE